ncbi:hypothetical protein AHAS_Ahas11G0205200 [Arachis hypogaea]
MRLIKCMLRFFYFLPHSMTLSRTLLRGQLKRTIINFVKKEELFLDAVKQYKVHCPDELSKIEERAKALEVIQYLKKKYHEGKCNVAIVDDGKLDTESDSDEFWVLFGGFAPIGKKVVSDEDIIPETTPAQLFRTKYLDCGTEVSIWVGRVTQVEEQKAGCLAAENFHYPLYFCLPKWLLQDEVIHQLAI